MRITIADASELTGKPISTLHRHTKQGVLTCSQNAQGQKVVDVAELYRVYPDTKSIENPENPKQETLVKVENSEPPTADSEIIAVLKSENEHLRSQLRIAQHQNDKLLGIIDNQTLALPKPAESEPEKKSWILRTFASVCRTLV